MHLSRRQFLGILAAYGLGSCARTPLKTTLDKLGGGRECFSFAALNDLHLLDARSSAIVNCAVADINGRSEVRFTVVLGDLATNGTLGELDLAKVCLDRLEKPYFVVPGNHDVNPIARNMYSNYETTFGHGNWRHDEGGWVFLGIDSCEGAASDVAIRPDRIEWLKKQVDHIKPGKPIALFAHHPFNPHTQQYRVKNADEVLALLSGHNLKLVAAGHYHGNQVEEQNGVLFTTTACCSSTRGNFDGTPAKGYRLFHIDGESIRTEFVEVAP
jgi:3',5'-cyclic AMP phosphodiesterase CpdA